jgi:hypothetical protein
MTFLVLAKRLLLYQQPQCTKSCAVLFCALPLPGFPLVVIVDIILKKPAVLTGVCQEKQIDL